MSVVYFNHCIDTEGPMVESLSSTFARVSQLFGYQLEPSEESLVLLQNGNHPEIKNQDKEKVASVFSKNRLNYKKNWDEIIANMQSVMSNSFRTKFSDDQQKPYLFNFYMTDFTGFRTNPRSKCDSPHGIYEKYMKELLDPNFNDGLYWHYHHVPTSGIMTEWGTDWSSSNEYNKVLARKIIDKKIFPSVYRAGGHIEREDISYWLEQWIPFDFSNHSHPSFRGRRILDQWSEAPDDWSCYHPSYENYQHPGTMKRWVFRCLDIDTREYQLEENEVIKAFERAKKGEKTILSVYSHDYKELAPEIEMAMSLVQNIKKSYPEVPFLHSNSLDAARDVLKLKPGKKTTFHYYWDENALHVSVKNEFWGSQPFLAWITLDGEYLHDNFIRLNPSEFVFYFKDLKAIEKIGLASNNAYGDATVIHIYPGISNERN